MSLDIDNELKAQIEMVERPRYFISCCVGVGLALFASGAAALINQVVWQRSLRIYLGGSEAICSMVVVLVFMAGLGAGSILMSYRSRQIRHPLFALGLLETILALVNLCIMGILSTDLSNSVFGFQKAALSLGVPLLFLYTVSALMVLIVPCFLMGATMPVAAEACQRNLGIRHSRLLGLLFFINTLGSVLGTLVSSGFMIAYYGLSTSLAVAVCMNLVAGFLLVILAGVSPAQPPRSAEETEDQVSRRPSRHLVLAFGLGFCSLAYEMYLLRIIPLRHEPLPFTFAAVLAGFLLFWSIGAALSACQRRISLSLGMRGCALTSMATVVVLLVDSPAEITNTWTLTLFVATRFLYFVPCLFFGYLFGLVVREVARSWGQDVGRIYAWNTVGSCLAILAMTVIGYEMPYFLTILFIAFLLFGLQEYADSGGRRVFIPLGASLVIAVIGLTLDLSRLIPGVRMYSGADGVILIYENGDMFWDGLWHSKLSASGKTPDAFRSHIGTRNWYLGICPVLAHSSGPIEDVCVIGVGTGITASTLSKLRTVKQVDAYDISTTLKQVFADFPDGTLGIESNPKINILWQDARTGMELNPKQYDIIQTQPLYLKQSGSSILNSVEFYRLIRSRLKPGGVFCLYSNGTPEQAFVIRQTADQVFRYRESFFNGYLLVLSQEPIIFDEKRLEQKFQSSDPLWSEIRQHDETSSTSAIRKLVDQPIPDGDGQLLIKDDHPIVEYPEYLKNQQLGLHLPQPH